MLNSRYFGIFFLLSVCANAQQPVESRAGTLQQAIFDPTARSSVSTPSVGVSLDGSLDQGTAIAHAGIYVHDFVLDAKLSAPLGKNANQATFLDLDGLANKSTADFGATWVKWNPTADATRQMAACEAQLLDQGIAATAGDADKMLRKTTDKGEIAYPCTHLALKGKYRDQFDRAVEWGTPLLLTVRAKVGRQEYQFVRPPAYQDQKQSDTSYALTGAAGVILAGNLIQADFQYQKSYQAADSQQICTPLQDSVNLQCRDTSVGAPAVQQKRLVEMEGRFFPSAAVGFNPRISYDLNQSAVSLQLPIYMFRAKEGGLNGGVIAGWRSDTHTLKMSVFVGQLFTLLSR